MRRTSEYDAAPMDTPAVGWVRSVERAESLDGVVKILRPLGAALVADPRRRDLLQGMWLGHAVHPVLTDVTLGFWTSANTLDLIGGRQSRPAADRLLALGILSALPTALTGLAEWTATGGREQRVGVVHAVANTVALTLYTASWRARARDRRARGVALALAGTAAAGVGGLLGGHLAAVRGVSSRHPGFEEPAAV